LPVHPSASKKNVFRSQATERYHPKVVVSTTFQEPLEWNNSTQIKGNVAEEIDNRRQTLVDLLMRYVSKRRREARVA
jgi:hypothetical protein